MTLFQRRSVFAFVLGATLAAAVLVGRSAFATTETISACFKPSNGTLYLLGESSGRHECQPGDIPISWNTSGVNGQDGVSVTSQALARGDANCANGGSKFTAVSGVTYACNGSNGVDGQDGQDGQDGADGANVTIDALAPGDDPACPKGGTKFTAASDVSYACNGADGVDGQDGRDGVDGQDGDNFSGTFTAGDYSLVINNTTAKMQGPNGTVQITPSGLLLMGGSGNLALTNGGTSLTSAGGMTLNSAASLVAQANSASLTSAGPLTMQAGSASLNSGGPLTVQAGSAALNSGGAFTIHSNAVFSASGLVTAINGTQQIILNGNQCGVLRSSDVALGPGGGALLLNPGGSPTVRIAGPCLP